MTVSVVQERQSSSSATGTTIALAYSSALTVGSALHAAASNDTGGGVNVSSCIATTNGSFGAALDNVNDSINAQRLAHWALANIGSGVADTVTVSFSATTTFRGIWIKEIGGCSASPLDGNTGQNQAGSTGTDAVSSGNATNTQQPALLSSFVLNSGTTASTITQGTGFTLGATDWNTIYGGNQVQAASESKRITSSGAGVASTYTTGTAVRTVAVQAIFDEAPAGVSWAPSPRASVLQGWPALSPLYAKATQRLLRRPFGVTQAGPQTFTQTLSASQSQSAALPQQAQLVRSLGESASASMVRTLGVSRSATQATTAARSPTSVSLARAATQAQAATVKRAVAKTFAAIAQATTVALGKAASRTLGAIAQAAAATLSTLKVKLLTLTVSQATGATLARAVGTIRTASQASALTLHRAVAATRSATQASSASSAKGVSLIRALAQVTSATLARGLLKFVSLSATVASSATLRKAVGATRSAIATLSASLASVFQHGTGATITLPRIFSVRTEPRVFRSSESNVFSAKREPRIFGVEIAEPKGKPE